EALSYVWGDATQTRLISCDAKKLKITFNLDEALQAIRHPERETLLWVDAICINQKSVEERNHQVKLMSKIYNSTRRVLVWLGPGRDTYFQDAHLVATDPVFAERVLEKKAGQYNTGLISSLAAISRCAWFERMWTIQEIGLASDAIFMMGFVRITWKHLYAAYEWLQSMMPSLRTLLWWERISFEPDQVLCLYNWNSTHSEGSFLRLLVVTEQRQMTDPRDRIFALLSHPSAQVKDPQDSTLSLVVEADYKKTYEEVYRDVAARLITTSNSLDVLSYIRGFEKGCGLPTWVPDWGDQRWINGLLDSHVQFTADGSASSPTSWITTGPEPHHPMICAEKNAPGYGLSVIIGRVSWHFRGVSTGTPHTQSPLMELRSVFPRVWKEVKNDVGM
ncbi:HET-domain-containing protein, partial [Ophiobolus disseminans]